MPRKSQPWFRWYVEAAHDRKIRRLTPAQRWLFVAMCSAGKESPQLGRLLVSDDEPMTDQEIAEYAAVPLREVVKALPIMERLKMVERDSEGVLVVINLQHRQYESDSSTTRVRNHRERSKGDVGTLQPSSEKRYSNGCSNAPDTETETEQKKPSVSRSRKRAKTDMPKDWQPNERHLAKARELGVPTRGLVDAFKAHHEARGNQFVNWDQAFFTWITNAPKFAGNAAPTVRQRPAEVYATPPAEPVEPLEWAR